MRRLLVETEHIWVDDKSGKERKFINTFFDKYEEIKIALEKAIVERGDKIDNCKMLWVNDEIYNIFGDEQELCEQHVFRMQIHGEDNGVCTLYIMDAMLGG